jgi:hypothetical protein
MLARYCPFAHLSSISRFCMQSLDFGGDAESGLLVWEHKGSDAYTTHCTALPTHSFIYAAKSRAIYLVARC